MLTPQTLTATFPITSLVLPTAPSPHTCLPAFYFLPSIIFLFNRVKSLKQSAKSVTLQKIFIQTHRLLHTINADLFCRVKPRINAAQWIPMSSPYRVLQPALLPCQCHWLSTTD